MKLNYSLLFSVLALTAWQAQSEVFRVTDPRTGRITITNFSPVRQSDQEISAAQAQVATPAVVSSTGAPSPKRPVAPVKTLDVSKAREFPAISKDEQRARDSDRLQILQEELRLELDKLAKAEKAKSGDEVVARHRANIESLKREVASVK